MGLGAAPKLSVAPDWSPVHARTAHTAGYMAEPAIELEKIGLVPTATAVPMATPGVVPTTTATLVTTAEGAPSSGQLQKCVSLKPWVEAGLAGDHYLSERKGERKDDGPTSPTDGKATDLKNITLNVVNTDKEQAIAHVVSMAAAHDADIQSKHARVALQPIDVQGILRPEEKILAQLPVKIITGFPHADMDDGTMDVKGNCALALIEVDDEQGANPLNKSKPKGPQTLVFMYTGEVSHIIKGSGYEVCKGGWCCNKEWHRFEMSRSQGSAMGTVQVQTQLVNISCEEKNELRISKEGLPKKEKPCCTMQCCLKSCCDVFCVCCACCKLPTIKYDIDLADDEVETEALLGESAEFKGTIGDLEWSMTEESLVVNQITMKWLDPVSEQIQTTTAAISPEASRQEIACVAISAHKCKG